MSIRNAARAFDAGTRQAAAKIADYDTDSASASLVALRGIATTEAAARAIDEAAASAADLSDIAPILDRVADARTAERQAAEKGEAAERNLEAVVLGATAAVVVIVLLTITLAWPETRAEQILPADDVPADASATTAAAASEQATPSAYTTARPTGPILRKAAELCTNLGRVSDVAELRTLVGQAADVIDASGLIVWTSAPGEKELRAALWHGYSDEMLSRLPPLSKSADNAAARAFRSGQLQIVLARPGSSNGAVVAPLLTANGCVGVVSAEIRGGGESSESVQALAAIFAAQLATVFPAPPQSLEERAPTGTGGI
ncbi:MAG TPA: hypothetical protein VFP91_10615 [Vicinamibacterales bacterium]|nr:hypothetical protein [Vicinamibacterales bacterium]